jgi:cellulose synthase (UDP-forming)
VALVGWSLIILTLDTFALGRAPRASAASMATVEDDVTVVIPTTHEPLEVLGPVLAAATAMRATSNVVVMDDGHREWLAGMCHELGIDYRIRSAPTRGLGGQLASLISTTESGIMVVLAPDQIADRDLVERTLGHFGDPDVALVQTSIEAYNSGSFSHIGGDPFAVDRVVASRLDERGATLWRGGAALLRVSAVAQLGTLEADDLRAWLSVTLTAAGKRVVYHDEVLSRGRAPIDADEYASDRRARARVDASTLRRTGWGRGVPILSRALMARQLGSALEAWRSLAFLLMPAGLVMLGLSAVAGPVLALAVLFGVAFAVNLTTLYLLTGTRSPGRAVRDVLSMAESLGAVTSLFTDATRQTQRASGNSRRANPVLWGVVAVNALGLAALSVALLSGSDRLAWPVASAAALWCSLSLAIATRGIQRARSRAYGGDRRSAYRVEAEGHAFLDGQRTHVLDLSLRGVRVLTYAAPPAAEEYCAVTFTDARSRHAVVTGTVVDVRRRPHGHEVRVAFDPDQTYVLGVIVAGALRPHS